MQSLARSVKLKLALVARPHTTDNYSLESAPAMRYHLRVLRRVLRVDVVGGDAMVPNGFAALTPVAVVATANGLAAAGGSPRAQERTRLAHAPVQAPKRNPPPPFPATYSHRQQVQQSQLPCKPVQRATPHKWLVRL